MDLIDNKKVKVYMDTVCSCIEFKDVRDDIRKEICAHMIDAVEEHEKEGCTREEAIGRAIKQMGDPLDLGRQLNEVHKPRPEWSILFLALVFSLIGVLAIYTMGGRYIQDGMLKKSFFMIGAGIVIIVLLYFYDYRRLKCISTYIYFATTVLLLVGMNGNMVSVFITMDMAYLAPALYAIALSGMFAGDKWRKRKGIINLAIFLLPMAVFLFRSSWSSLGSGAMYFAMALVIAIISGINIKYIFGVVVSAVLIGLYSIFSVDYRAARILAFLNPVKDAGGSGYTNIQLGKVLSQAGLFGNGFNFDIKKIGIPAIHTNFILTYIIYTLGWIAGLVLISLIIVFFIRLIKTSKCIKNSYGRLIVASFASIFIVQFLYNILMILGVVPIAGFSLPFISYGTASNIANMAMIGIISSIYRRKSIS